MASTSAGTMNRSVSRSVCSGLGKVYGSFTPRDPTTGVQCAGYPPTLRIRVRLTMEPTHSKSGDPVYTHTTRAPDEFVHGDEALIDAVGAHVERHFGEIAGVYHEILSPWAHIDLFVVAPSTERPVTTVVTCGMAQFPMRGRRDGEQLFAELCLLLPPDWPTMDD